MRIRQRVGPEYERSRYSMRGNKTGQETKSHEERVRNPMYENVLHARESWSKDIKRSTRVKKQQQPPQQVSSSSSSPLPVLCLDLLLPPPNLTLSTPLSLSNAPAQFPSSPPSPPPSPTSQSSHPSPSPSPSPLASPSSPSPPQPATSSIGFF